MSSNSIEKTRLQHFTVPFVMPPKFGHCDPKVPPEPHEVRFSNTYFDFLYMPAQDSLNGSFHWLCNRLLPRQRNVWIGLVEFVNLFMVHEAFRPMMRPPHKPLDPIAVDEEASPDVANHQIGVFPTPSAAPPRLIITPNLIHVLLIEGQIAHTIIEPSSSCEGEAKADAEAEGRALPVMNSWVLFVPRNRGPNLEAREDPILDVLEQAARNPHPGIHDQHEAIGGNGT